LILVPTRSGASAGNLVIPGGYAAGSSIVGPLNLKPDQWYGGQFALVVTGGGTLVTDTLNVYVQSSWDLGTSWDDFVSFTQVKGNDSFPEKYVAYWLGAGVQPTTPIKLAQDAALAAASVQQGATGQAWRVKWVPGGSFTGNITVYFNPLPRFL